MDQGRKAQSILGRFLPRSLALSLALHAVGLGLGWWLVEGVLVQRETFARDYSLEIAAVRQEPNTFPEPLSREALELEPPLLEPERLVVAEPQAELVLFPERQPELELGVEHALRGGLRRRISSLEFAPKAEVPPVNSVEVAPPIPSPDGDWSPPVPSAAIERQAPRILVELAPEYPRLSQRLGESGQVGLEITIDAKGRATDARVLTSSGHARLDEAARTAVLTWTYAPATENGVAIAGFLRHSVRFAFQDKVWRKR